MRAYHEDLRHPLRHPGNTFLDLIPVAAGGGIAAAKAPARVRRFVETERPAKARRKARREARAGKRPSLGESAREFGKVQLRAHKALARSVSPLHKARRQEERIFDRPGDPLQPLYAIAAAGEAARLTENAGRVQRPRPSRLRSYPR